jgi:enoyl-CoA hydratase
MRNLVTYQLEDSIATLVMDDGKVNVLSTQMMQALNAQLDQAHRDQAAVLLLGRPGVFSAGFDLAVLGAGGENARIMVSAGFALAERVLSFPQPVIIGCTGHALAMAAFLLLSADLRLGAAGKFKIGANEVAMGITMPHFGIEICRQRLAPAQFNRAVINSEMFSPDEAALAGFLDRVVPAQELGSAALEAARGLAKLNRTAYAATKLRTRSQALTAVRAAIAADSSQIGVVQ